MGHIELARELKKRIQSYEGKEQGQPILFCLILDIFRHTKRNRRHCIHYANSVQRLRFAVIIEICYNS